MTGLDPDQLLKSLDAQIAAARSRRLNLRGNHDTARMTRIMALVLGSAIALFALQYVMTDFLGSHRAHQANAQRQSQQPPSVSAK